MATSYASLHKQQIRDARIGEMVADSGSTAALQGNEYRSQLVKLETDIARLSTIRSIRRKQAIKREILPSYWDYIQCAINRESGLQDDILVTVLIWCIDVGEYSRAFMMAAYALQHGMEPPERFTRTLAEVITEEFSSHVLKADTPADYLDWLQHLETLVMDVDMVDAVTAKFHKALGLALEPDNPQQALRHYQTAFAADPKSAVKRMVNRLEKQLAEEAD